MELARTVACSELVAIAAGLAEDEDAATVGAGLRRPGEVRDPGAREVDRLFGLPGSRRADLPGDDRDSFEDEPMRPGERIIDGRRFYSAAWL